MDFANHFHHKYIDSEFAKLLDQIANPNLIFSDHLTLVRRPQPAESLNCRWKISCIQLRVLTNVFLDAIIVAKITSLRLYIVTKIISTAFKSAIYRINPIKQNNFD